MRKLRYLLFTLFTVLFFAFLTGCGGTEDSIGGADGPTSVYVKEDSEDSDGEYADLKENPADSDMEYGDLEEDSGDPDEDYADYDESGLSVEEDGTYTTKEEVALYIHTYGHLPSNFISKTKARKAGWDSSEGNLDDVLPGMSIGGSQFKNYDGQLPDAEGRTWTECDINYHGGYRGAERIIFSNDGLIYYTDDHYETFEQLY